MNVVNEALFTQYFKAPQDGIYTIHKKSIDDKLEVGEPICSFDAMTEVEYQNKKIKAVFFTEHHLDNALVNDGDGYSHYNYQIEKALKDNGEFVDKGESVFDIIKKKGVSIHPHSKGHFYSPFAGYIDYLNKDFYSLGIENGEMLFKLYESKQLWFDEKYDFKSKIIQDNFTDNIKLEWDLVAGYKRPFGSYQDNPIGGLIIPLNEGISIIISLNYIEGKDAVIISFFKQELRLLKNSIIHFRFDDGQIFSINLDQSPRKSLYPWKGLYDFEIYPQAGFFKLASTLKLEEIKLESKSASFISEIQGDRWYNQQVLKSLH